jgi:hypothetical protein
MAKQNPVSGDWSAEDEKEFKRLATKRLKVHRGTKGHDIQFAEDIFRGEAGENLVVQALLKGEVKTDFGVGNTGNVFIEYMNYGKPSGIDTTDADFWVFVLEGEHYSGEVFVGIKTDRLKRIFDKFTWSVNGGDNKASKGKIVPVRKLLLAQV